MSCSQKLSGIALDCLPSKGGIVTVWISNADGVSVTVEGDEVTNIAGADWKQYNFRKGTGSMTCTLNVDNTAGVRYVSTELVLQFSHMETSKRVEMAALSWGEFVVVVKDANGSYWLLGYDDTGLFRTVASAGTGQTGTAMGDGNYYQMTLTAECGQYPVRVSEQLITGGYLLMEDGSYLLLESGDKILLQNIKDFS